MKTFFDYIAESEKQYDFKIRVAGPKGEGITDKLESALKKYDLISVSTATKTPIQEMPLHFPNVQNVEIYTHDVKVRYPVTAAVLRKYVGDCLGITETHILVTSPTEPFEELTPNPAEKADVYEPLLPKEEMEQADPKAQDKVGTNRVMDLLKELEAARAERKEGNPTEGAPRGSSKDISPKTNTKSVVGG